MNSFCVEFNWQCAQLLTPSVKLRINTSQSTTNCPCPPPVIQLFQNCQQFYIKRLFEVVGSDTGKRRGRSSQVFCVFQFVTYLQFILKKGQQLLMGKIYFPLEILLHKFSYFRSNPYFLCKLLLPVKNNNFLYCCFQYQDLSDKHKRKNSFCICIQKLNLYKLSQRRLLIIININMERNKPDYSLSNDIQKLPNPFSQHKPTENISSNMNESMFMRYASSIIQVVNEQKLERQEKLGNEGQHKSPVYEVSEVNYFDADPSIKNSGHIYSQQNNYNIFGHHFKKKSPNKHLLVYNFSNFTLLINALSPLTKKNTKYAFNILFNLSNQQKHLPHLLPKNRASFHSDYTNSSSHEQLGTIKTIKLQKKVKRNEEMREGADQIKGWLQFRILMIKNVVFKQLFEFSSKKPISPFNPPKRNNHFVQHFDFSQFNNDQSLSLQKSLRRQEEQSMAFTADQNFQFSQKDMPFVTPQKFTLEDRFNVQLNEFKNTQNKQTNIHDSMVQIYKINHKNSLKPQKIDGRELKASKPISLKINEQRRYLNLRTNIYQLPLISQFYFNEELAGNGKDLSTKIDCMIRNEPEVGSDIVNGILRDIETTQMQLQTKEKPLQSKHSKRSSENSYVSSLNEKSTKLGTGEQSKLGKLIISQKNISEIKKKQRQTEYLATDNNKKGPIKIQNYYFPGRQITKTKEEAAGINIQQRSNMERTPSSHQKSQKPLRFEESLVNNFVLPEQAKLKQIKPLNPIKQRGQYITEVRFTEQKNPSKINITMQSPNRRLQPSPSGIQIQNLGSYYKKMQMGNSPQPVQRNRSPYDQIPPRPIHEEFSSNIKGQKIIRIGSKDKVLQPHPYQQNIYQINKQNSNPVISPPKSYINFNNPYTNDTRKQTQHQMHQQTKIQYQNSLQPQPHTLSHIQPAPLVSNQHQPQLMTNRPHSRLISQPNFPPQNMEHQNYGLQNFRQTSQKKISFHSPQSQKNISYAKPIQFIHEIRPEIQKNRIPLVQEYFMMEPQGSNLAEKAVNFNNRYYTSGTPARPAQIMIQQNIKQVLLDNSNGRRSYGSERAQSFRPPSERINFVTNSSPMESQLEWQQPSNYFSSRNGSELNRPKSMNEKIHLVMRRER